MISPEDPDGDLQAGQLEDQEADVDDGKRRVLAAPFAGVEPAPLPPVGPDGAPGPDLVGQPAPLPPADARTFICLRDCRYYWEMRVHLDAGNPEETWDPVLGLRDVVLCPACGGRQGVLRAPALAASSELACGYVPSQGRFARQTDNPAGTPCQLEADHVGPHHHASHAPLARELPCGRCKGKGYVVDPASPVVQLPKRVVRSCLRHVGVDTELNDTIVYDCSEWDPVSVGYDEVQLERDRRRRGYLAAHPETSPLQE